MIEIQDDTPAWIHSLERFAALKNLLFLHGNIHDRIPFLLSGEQLSASPVSDHDVLPNFLLRYFVENRGYEIAGILDPCRSIRFHDEIFPSDSRDENSQSMRERYNALPPTGNASNSAQAWSDPDDLLRGVETLCDRMQSPLTSSVFVIHLASRLLTGPDHLDDLRLRLFTRIQMACAAAPRVRQGTGKPELRNLIILTCEKLNDLPAFLYLDNPASRSLCVPKPNEQQRERYLSAAYARLPGADPNGANEALLKDFVDRTDGMTFVELQSLKTLASMEAELQGLTFGGQNARRDLARLIKSFQHGKQEDKWLDLEDRMRQAEKILNQKVKGQESAKLAVLDVVKGAKFGIEPGSADISHRPRGVLFFAGPTGVGKTELAKALAHAVFGDENRLIRFDMSEYGSQHADQRLLGAPPGYVGYEEGGQLTNAVREQPYSVLLFDEIDKAHESIFLKFLQILDDGRITDGHGETVHFSESILVFTSNEGLKARPVKDTQGQLADKEGKVTPNESEWPFSRIREVFERRIQYFFEEHMGRPEIYNRFGKNFIVFDFIRPDVDQEILEQLIQKFIEAHHNRDGLELLISDEVREELLKIVRQEENIALGGRGIRNVVESALVKPVHRELFDYRGQPQRAVVTALIEKDKETDYYEATVNID